MPHLSTRNGNTANPLPGYRAFTGVTSLETGRGLGVAVVDLNAVPDGATLGTVERIPATLASFLALGA